MIPSADLKVGIADCRLNVVLTFRSAIAGTELAVTACDAHGSTAPPQSLRLSWLPPLFPDVLHQLPRRALPLMPMSYDSSCRNSCALSAATEFSIAASCFMPDHVHLLVQGASETSDARLFIKLGKQYAAYAYSRKFGRKLWQPWGFERVLRTDEASLAVARYIVENPVRAGLAKTVSEYPFVGSELHELKDLLDSLPT